MNIGDKFYSKKFVLTIMKMEDNGMYGINFNSRDGRESNYNIVSEEVIRAMITHEEWVTGEDPWKI